MYFIITIDTEEDQWSNYTRDGQTLENIESIPKLQSLFEKYGARPTYFISYPVATDPKSIDIFKDIAELKKGEIGAHCHPWNTPPFIEKINTQSSMLCNLEPDLQYKKLKSLTDTIKENIGVTPVSFRAGRWGYNSDVAINLFKLGYQTDSSLTPFMNWEIFSGPDLSSSPQTPFFFNPERPLEQNKNGSMLQVPVSIGFNRNCFQLSHQFYSMVEKNKWSKKIFIGGLSRLGILKKYWLSPENSTSEDMVSLIRILQKKGYKYFNFMFHSNSLLPGKTPFVRTSDELNNFIERIETVLAYAVRHDFQFTTLSEIRSRLQEDRRENV